MPRKPRAMIFVESDQGFGHFNIVDRISKELVEKGADVAIVSGNFDHAGDSFVFSAGEKMILPCVKGAPAGCPGFVGRDGSPYNEQHQQERKAYAAEILNRYQPDVIMFELYPFMNPYRNPELEAVSEWKAGKAHKIPVISLTRDIIHSGSPDNTIALLDKHFDEVLVRGCGKIVKLEDSMPEWSDIRVPVSYIGNIVAPMPAPSPTPGPVIVFGGGGHYPHIDNAFFENSIRARAKSIMLSQQPWTIIVSENCSEEIFHALCELAHREAPDGSITVTRPTHNESFRQMLADAPATIMRGGYNTSFELAAAQRPFLMIPRPPKATEAAGKHNDEQRMRAEAMQRHGFCGFVPQEEATPEHIAHALDQQVSKANNVELLNTRGAETCSAQLYELAQMNIPQNDIITHMAMHVPPPSNDREEGFSVG